MKAVLKVQLIVQRIRARKQQARIRARIAEKEAYLTIQMLIAPDLKALDQHTACCGPKLIRSRKEM